MSVNNESQSDTNDPPLPEGLLDALRSCDTPPAIDERVDQQILDAVRPHLVDGRQRRRRWVLAKLGAGLAAAACVALFLFIDMETQLGDVAPGAQTSEAAPAVDDLNADGKVDILDAFLMQRRLENGFTQYGRQDVQRLRRRLVEVSG